MKNLFRCYELSRTACGALALTIILTACGGGGGGGGASLPAGPSPLLATQIAAGNGYNCALLDTGQVKCWGSNNSGNLGLGDLNNRGDGPDEMGNNLPAVDLGTGRTATQIAAGNGHTCALLDTGQVKCWGDSSVGQLGLGNTSDRGDEPNEIGDSLPAVDLGTDRTATHITAASHTCALLDTGQVKCWGSNNFGKLGLGDLNNRGDEPNEMGDNLPAVDLGTGRTATRVAVGTFHTCALLDTGQVKCWGRNSTGQLGLGDTNNRGDQAGQMGDNLPAVDLGTDRTATHVAAGREHTCALLDNGLLKCWGNNNEGQLGLGGRNNRGDALNEMGDNLPVVDLGTERTATQVVAGSALTCALLNSGEAKCWGRNHNGQLGLGDIDSRGDQAGEMGDALPAVDLGTR